MISTLKNIKWILLISLVCILLGILTFFTFINQSFVTLTEENLQFLLVLDLISVLFFFILVLSKTINIIRIRKKQKIGFKTNLKYIYFFSFATLLPSFLIALFSLYLFNVGLQKYFDKQIKSAVNNSYDVAKNYVEESRNAIQADTLLIAIDINRNSNLFYDNINKFNNILKNQRLLRRVDEVHLVDGAGNIIISDLIDITKEFVPPPEEAFNKAITGMPIRITDAITNRTSALLKLGNFIDTYLYIVRFMDPKVINYLKETEQAISFYYNVENRKTGIKITFALIYLVLVSLLLFISVNIAINFATQLITPIINLISASERISKGDLTTKVPLTKSNTEIDDLNENFNFMIEKLKKQQDKLLLSEKHEAWESVARKLAHEIKNPLTPIQLATDRIKDKYLHMIKNNEKDFSSYLNTINKQIKYIEHLLNEFSDFARMPKPVLRSIDLKDIIVRSVKLNELSQSKIKINFNSSNDDKYIVEGDEEQLNRVYINLIKNSMESLYDKLEKNSNFIGKINIEIYTDKDYIYSVIQDNGIGFDTNDIKKMLTPYYTTKKEGTGLGLAIVNKIINDHNGNINFSSNNGARIEILIPKKND